MFRACSGDPEFQYPTLELQYPAAWAGVTVDRHRHRADHGRRSYCDGYVVKHRAKVRVQSKVCLRVSYWRARLQA
ncbi:hypothetical protein [Mycetohabitans sp. B46]|uniref:hypothetical protein n=1 Tax=Mycetohabitans sp. B46 TaxID=2772536 RepID=UPI00307EA8B0